MAKQDLSTFDTSERQRDILQRVIEGDQAQARENEGPVLSVAEARERASLYEMQSSREATRILFISRDTSLLNPTTQTLDGYLNVSDVFDEVHIVVLRPGIRAKDPVLRVAHNVWVYVATAQEWWLTPWAAKRLIDEQLVFADGFRPDLIVARDPFESAYTAHLVAKSYERPTQVHVLENFLDKKFVTQRPGNRWRRRLARYLLPRFASVRTATQQLKTIAERLAPDAPDIEVLPRFNNYDSLVNATSSLNLKEKYKQFVFIILYVGELGHESTLHRAIDAARFVLRNPRVGMVVVGDGAARNEFIKRTELFGIAKQVVFERRVDDLVGYLKTADIAMVTDTTAVADEFVVQAAAAGLPLLMTPTTYRTDLFTDMESALITASEETSELSQKLSYFLNNVGIRKTLKLGAQTVVTTALHEDPEVYRQSYRDSVERGLLVGRYSAPPDEDGADEPSSAY